MREIWSPGEWLRRRRKALDLTQDELAAAVGCSKELIAKIEQDARRPSKQVALREQLGALMWPVDRPEYERMVADARAALGDDVFAVAWAEGRTLRWEQAIEEALAWLEQISRPEEGERLCR